MAGSQRREPSGSSVRRSAEPDERELEKWNPGFTGKGSALAALTTSALALPGMAPNTAQADAPIERAQASAAFSYYREDKISPGKFDDSSGSRERYEVFTEQLRFDLPVSDRIDVGLDFLYEEMSGASPWFVIAGPQGQLLQVMSGATIEDQRLDVAADIDFYLDNGKDTLSGGFSKEKDYLSGHIGIAAERNYNDKNTTLNLAAAFAYDTIEPTDADLFPTIRPEKETRYSIDLFGGLSQILTRASTAQVTVNYKHSNGYLGDPYKAVNVLGGGNLSDERPDEKNQVSVLLRYRHHIEPISASVHLDYRFYADDWQVISQTAELAWYQQFFDWLTVTPAIRWYSQSKADFYEPVLPVGTAPAERTSDFRLSPYGAISAKLKIDLELVDPLEYGLPDALRFLEEVGLSGDFDLIASLSYERYLSDGNFSIVHVPESDEAPGLVDFQVVAFTLSGRF